MAPENLGILVYGRNIGMDTHPEGEKLMREVLKTARTQPKEKKELRTKEDIKEEEIEMLQDKYRHQHLPRGWYFDGRAYYHRDEPGSQYEHPNLDMLIDEYMAEVNKEVVDFNEGVQKEWTAEEKQFS